MSRFRYAAMVLACVTAFSSGPVQGPTEARKLYDELTTSETTDCALGKILVASERDADMRNYIVTRLQDIIAGQNTGEVWRNALRLAGHLPAPETLPTLMGAFSQVPVNHSIFALVGREEALLDDPVGKALSQIRDPAVGPISKLLASSDRDIRRRVVLILINIDSASSTKVLREHRDRETDTGIKTLIERRVPKDN
jgi:hypothetical protein